MCRRRYGWSNDNAVLHYASRFRSVTVPSPFRQNGLCTLSVLFSHLTEQHVIGGLQLFPSNMQLTATECIFRYLLITLINKI